MSGAFFRALLQYLEARFPRDTSCTKAVQKEKKSYRFYLDSLPASYAQLRTLAFFSGLKTD